MAGSTESVTPIRPTMIGNVEEFKSAFGRKSLIENARAAVATESSIIDIISICCRLVRASKYATLNARSFSAYSWTNAKILAVSSRDVGK